LRYEPATQTVTPEAVRLRTDVAGIGSRSIALMVDILLQALVLIPVVIIVTAGGVSGLAESVVLGVSLFVVLWLYFPMFEWLRDGQTPGKRAQGIRVVRTTGQPAGFAPVMIRNLLRVIEVYALPFIALTSMFFTARVQRLGDIAADTMVVRDRAMPAPQVLSMSAPDARASAIDASRLGEREYALLRTFLARRASLDPAASHQLARSLATVLRRQLGDQPAYASMSDEDLINAAVQSYRARFSSGG
jgi:uncharacterized RDD family membrane protein YckC